jgi:glycosyltransferase involved in cell wall biosynthesis
MHIAIDALGIHNFGGGRTATLNFLQGLCSIDQQNTYEIFMSQAESTIKNKFGNFHQVIIPFKNRMILRLWAQINFPIRLRKFDLVHYAKNLGVIGMNIPSVSTVYDVTTLIHPELFPKFDVWYWKTICKKTFMDSSRIIAISNSTACDLEMIYKIPRERISVIYPSVHPRFKPVSAPQVALIREKYNLPKKYLLHVGRIDIKKNLVSLVKAYDSAKKSKIPGFTEGLVLVGEVYKKGEDKALLPTIEELCLTKEVIFTGGIPDDELPAIMSGAYASISVSLHEGFGLAPIEAMACGTPVIAYKAGAVQEAAGDAALILDKFDPESISKAILQLFIDTELREELSKNGLIRAQQFQSEQNSFLHLQLYKDVVNEN